MRILWHSAPFWVPTGYGTQSKNCIYPLRDTYKHDVAYFCRSNYNGKGILNIQGFRVYPFGDFDDGHDAVLGHVQHWGADAVIGLYDAWVIPPEFHKEWEDVPYVMLAPIDHDPIGQVNVNHIKAVVDFPVAFSKFGYEQMVGAGLKNVSYVPHCIDTNVYKPLDRKLAKAMRGRAEDEFWIGMFGANLVYPNRKAIPESLLAVAEMQRRHKDAHLYVHAFLYPTHRSAGEGLFLGDVIEQAGIDIDRIDLAPQYEYRFGILNETFLSRMYNAVDVTLHPSYGEGFGLCIAESQACGTPVITQQHSSMTELTVNGICMEPWQRFWNALGGWFAMPSVERMVDALEELYDRWKARPQEHAEEAAKGVAFIQNEYSVDHVMETYWVPLLERVMEERAKRKAASEKKVSRKRAMKQRSKKRA